MFKLHKKLNNIYFNNVFIKYVELGAHLIKYKINHKFFDLLQSLFSLIY